MSEGPRRRRLCPECGGPVRSGRQPFTHHGEVLGDFDVTECVRCRQYAFTASGSRAIEKVAKARGLFGFVKEAPIGLRHGVMRKDETPVPP